MDSGVINSVKIHYRRRILKKALLSLEDDNETREITILDAISNLSKAWNINIQERVIKNCFTKAGFRKESEIFTNEVDNTSLEEFSSVFGIYSNKIGCSVILDDYLSIDYNVSVVNYPTDAEIVYKIKKQDQDDDEDVLSDEMTELSLIQNEISNKEMRLMLSKCNQYLCSKQSTSKEVYQALQILENFVDNECLSVTQSKITDFFHK